MFSNEQLYTDLDSYSSVNRLFNPNDGHNIWSNDNYFNNNRNVFNPKPERCNRNSRKPGERAATNLIVNYLPDGFYEDDLHNLFKAAGPIHHHHVVRNKDSRSECYGFVDFEKASDAEKAIDMFHQCQIQNKKLKVQNAAEGLLIKEEEKIRAAKGLNNIGYNVEIKNSPSRWTINDVKNIFGKYGEILKVYEQTKEDVMSVDKSTDNRTKTFNVVFRYETIAKKVIMKKNNQVAEPRWPLELELSFVGQEFVDQPLDNSRSTRPRPAKLRFDQMSDCSWDNKVDNKFDNFGQKGYESSMYGWSDNMELARTGLPLTSNGRPILKHKDNLMHLNGSVYEMNPAIDSVDKWSNGLSNDNLFFDHKIRGSCNDIKAIWEPKESILNDPIPQDIFMSTPLLPSRFRNDDKFKHKANVWFKMENMQPTGSFKLRGMAYWCYKAKIDGIQLVVSSSGGNAGLAAAYACRMLKLKCTVVVPNSTPVSIIGELLKENAEVIQEGSCWKEAHIKAESIVSNYPLSRLVHPYDNSLLWTGYESIVDEIVTDMKGARIDMIVLSVGGGGLLNGIAQGITKNKLNKTTAILAMETEGAACLNRSIAVNRIVPVVPNSVATSLGASTISPRTWEIYCNKEFHLFSKLCSDGEAIDACCQFLNEQNCLVEPACGATLSTIYNGTLDQMAQCRNCDLNVVVIVCGGRCVDIHNLMEMRQVFSAILPPASNNYDVMSYDNTSNFDINDRFISMNLNKDNYPGSTAAETDIYYDSSRFNIASDYNQMFPSLTKSSDSTNCTVLKSNILTESKFCYQRNINEMSNSHSNFNNYQSINTEPNYMSNDLMSSPVGSQLSDKENRMLPNDN